MTNTDNHPKYVRCNACYHVEEAADGVDYPRDGKFEGQQIQCPACQRGFLWGLCLETTPEKVARSRAKLEADRKRNSRRDAIMLNDPEGRGMNRPFSERLRAGFSFLEG